MTGFADEERKKNLLTEKISYSMQNSLSIHILEIFHSYYRNYKAKRILS